MPTAPSVPAAIAHHGSPGRALRILYADDMPELRALMTDILTREGHTIETMDDGRHALARLRQAPQDFDLLITDHNMPDANGLELVCQTRELHFTGKIVVISSELNQAEYEQYRDFAVDAILAKPIFPLSFRGVLKQLFEPENPGPEPVKVTPVLPSPHG